jgi:hypothetical protein
MQQAQGARESIKAERAGNFCEACTNLLANTKKRIPLSILFMD